MDKKELNSMFENLLHIGNKTNHWNPKMKEYIYGSSNGVHVFNLIKTASQITAVKAELSELAKQGKKVLFVSTKLQARDAFSTLAVETNNYFVNEKWVPGLLTNFKTIKKRISTYLQLLKESSNGSLDMLTKKEKAYKLLELEKLDRAFKGVKEMKRLPDVVFVVDGGYELQAVKEAKSLSLPCYALANTNTDPDLVTNLIPANTNSIKSIEYIAAELKGVVKSSGAPVKGGGFKKMEHKKPLAKAAAKPAAKKEEKAVEKKEDKKIEEKTEAKVEKKAPAKKTEAKKEEK
ncbi:30S ribosomal protein S2 [Candidatus Gracilibacteria bacterium]|nr:30S ribosomal protein S2 [Candidatus Gracilibacteria bacterium]